MIRYPIPLLRLALISLLALLFAAPWSLFGQTQFRISTYLLRDDNAFRSRNQTKDLINTTAFYGARTWGTRNWGLQTYYNGDFSRFMEYTDRKTNTHQMGLSFTRMLDESVMASLALSGRMRSNTNDFNFYDTREYRFSGNVRWEVSPGTNISVGLLATRNNFTNFTEITNNEFLIHAQFQQFYATRTSVTVTGGLGHKIYPNQSLITQAPIRPRIGVSQFDTDVEATQVTLGVTVGQSLANRTGLSGSLGLRKYMSDPIEQFINDEYFFTENDLFDDPYAYESYSAGVALTHQFAVGFQAKVGADVRWKDYKGTPAFDPAGNVQAGFREDTRKEYYFRISKEFLTNWRVPETIKVFSNILLRENKSNDGYYNYFDHLGLFGLSLSF